VAFALGFASPILALAQGPDPLLLLRHQGDVRFRANTDGGLFSIGIFDGDYDGESGMPEGAGTRMIWYPRKAAFRAGRVDYTQWNYFNIGDYSVAFGENSRASASHSTAMGRNATASQASAFAAGEDVTASGSASVALGYHAHTNARQGSFVFGDRSTVDTVRANHNHQATFRVSCGFRIYTSSNQFTGIAIGGAAVTNISPATTCPTYQFDQTNTMIATSTGAYLSSSGVWTNASDLHRKHLFADVSGEFVLSKLRTLPIRTWSYKVDDPRVRHLGPTAQDFRAAFGLGPDSTTIGTIDEGGVALIAIQALDRSNIELKRDNVELRARLVRLEAAIAELVRAAGLRP
jgi:hypothetical protein